MKNYIFSQFIRPRGLFGELTGRLMARSNAGRAAWAVGLLDVQPDHRVIEVGFGPGVALEAAAEKAAFVAGVDISKTMNRQASRRNAKAIKEGRVELHVSPAESIPYEDETFDWGLAINTFPFWPDRAAGLQELRRVLKPGGVLAVAMQPRWAGSDDEVREIAENFSTEIEAAGFEIQRREFLESRPMMTFSILAVK